MTSPLDLWGSIPYLGLVWIAASLIHLARFAYAEINGRLAPRPLLFFARQWISDGVAWTIVVIANSAYSRGLISFATLMIVAIPIVWVSRLIAGKTPCPTPRRPPQLAASFIPSQACKALSALLRSAQRRTGLLSGLDRK